MATVRTPFTDTTIQRDVVAKMIGMIDRTDIPTFKRLGHEIDKRMAFENWPPGNSKRINWFEDTLSPRADQLNGSIDATQTNIVVDNGSYWHQGHILLIDNERMWVDSRSTNTLTVVRGYQGTTAATHADNAVVTMKGIAQKTGATYAIGHTTVASSGFNYTQTLEESVQVNNDQMDVTDYGVPDTMAYHMAKLIGGDKKIGPKGSAGQMLIHLNQLFFDGLKQAPTDNVASAAGGFPAFVQTNVLGDTATPLSRPTIETMLRTIWAAGGKPNLIITSAWGATKIASFYEGLVQTERTEETGGYVVTHIQTPVMPRIEILVDWMCPATKTYILDTDKVGWATVRPFFVTRMPSLGSYTVDSVEGEYSFVVMNEKSHAILTHSDTL